jgi:peptide/nickel transport system substrate-binding protein
MSILRPAKPAVAALLAVALISGACSPSPAVTDAPGPDTAPPSGSIPPTGSAAATPGPTELPFQRTAWPPDGSACGTPGYAGLLGRIEAVAARTVRFTLCAPDGAFLERLAHPALAILDTASVELLGRDRSSARSLAGTGPYRIEQWTPDDNVRLARVAPAPVRDAALATVVLRWAADPTIRMTELQAATVDGMDAPAPAQLDHVDTQPELAVVPRAELATAYLAFGSGPAFRSPAVRRAIAQALDRDALVADAFPAGSTVPTHVVPCIVDAACGGAAWYSFDGPAATAALGAAGFDLGATYPLHVPDQPVPGLPDPAGVAAAVQAQLETNAGVHVAIDVMPVADYVAAAGSGSLDGLYLGGLTSLIPDPVAFLGPLFAADAPTTPAARAPKVGTALADAATSADPAVRADAFTSVNDTIRRTAVIVPLAHPGSVAVYRSDVEGAVASPLGLDPLGTFTPGDRKQLVFMQSSEPDGAWCGDQSSIDAYRLCGLVLEGLYGFAPGTLTPVPRLAQGCEPDRTAMVWTCRLLAGVRFDDGARLDAGDVVSSFVAQWDRSQPLRAAATGTFDAWDALFGGTIDTGS